jgi:Family of unknown function (DUF6519)/Periplasmic copper-binding protein (NosD)
MTVDISRKSFRPRENFAGLIWQQGRVELDSERNEDWKIADRQRRIRMLDLVGHCGYPRTLPESFAIGVSLGALTIGQGRMYVDGLLAENHGLPEELGGTVAFDLPQEDERGTDPVPFDQQPWRPGVVAPDPADGRHLVYLDVWRRVVTYLEDPALVETAVGVDTTGREQTVWQVRALGGMPADATCESPDEDLPGWLDATQPTDGRLSSFPIPVVDPDDPCLLPPAAGYRALENRTYRVEIHDQAPDGTWRFKWSRWNGVVATRVLTVLSPTELAVARVAKDDVLRFEAGDWVEILDDRLELEGAPGIMRMVDVADPASDRITLRTPLPAGVFPTDADGTPDPDRNLRVRKWSQSGEVRASGGGLLADLTDETGPGVIALPPAGESVALEAGIAVSFSFALGGDRFRNGDWWVFVARTSDASIEQLDEAPPCGIHHHYCKLAFVDVAADGEGFVEPVTDCRDPFPEGGEGCCTVVVRPGESVQAALDSLPPEGGCVCLKAGLHVVGASVVIARSDVSLHGESQGAVLRFPGEDPVLAIRGSSFAEPAERVRVHGIRFEGGDISSFADGVVTVDDALDLRLEDCELRAVGQEQESASVGLRIAASRQVAVAGCGIADVQIGLWATMRSAEVAITNCRIELGAGGERSDGIVGIFVDNANGPFLVADSEIAGALFGVVIDDAPLGAPNSLARGSIIRANRVLCIQPAGAEPDAASGLVGIDVAAEDCLIEGNEVRYPGPGNIGIRVSGSGARVLDNRCMATNPEAGRVPALGLMIGVDPERADRLIANVEAGGNTISGAQSGIMVVQASDVAVVANDLQLSLAQAASFGFVVQDSRAVDILDNRIRGALAAIAAGSTGNLRVEGNTATGGTQGILVAVGERPTIVRNRIEGASLWGIALTQIIARAEVAANRVIGCGFGFATGLGIGAAGVLGELNLDSNEVMNSGNGPDEQRSARAIGLFGDLILEARVAGNLVTYSLDQARDPANEDRALLMRGYLEQTFVFGAAAITIGFPIQILGNKFIGTGRTALVELLQTQINDNILIRFERVTFNDNYCSHFSPPERDDSRATVSLEGRRGIVMGNHIKATTPDYFSVNFNFMPSTYVGNVVEGPAIQGTPIPTPASDYNLST